MAIFNTVYGGEKKWDIDKWTLAQTSSGLSSTWWGGVFFNPDGTKIYLTQYGNGGRIYQSDLSTPYDLSSINFGTYINLQYPEDIHFSPDGTKMFILKADTTPAQLKRYTLSTAWDITTATNDQDITRDYYDRGLYLSPDGTELYIGKGSGDLYYIKLSTAWDLTTASSATTIGSYGGLGIWFGENGKMFFNQTEGSSDLNYRVLSTPYDLSSTITSGTLNVGQNRSGGLWFNDVGTICVMVGGGSNTNYVTKYTL